MALDSCIPAGMTAFLARRNLCITARAGAWERSNKEVIFGHILSRQPPALGLDFKQPGVKPAALVGQVFVASALDHAAFLQN